MADKLTQAFYDKSKVILVTPLGARVTLGSVGYFSDGQWVEVSTTKDMFNIVLTADPGSAPSNSFSGKSGKGLKFEAKAAGEPSKIASEIVKANARVEITFGSAGSFVMNVKNQRVPTAGTLGDLMIAIRKAYRFRDTLPEKKRWEKHYAVIVGIASADSVTALLSSVKNASVIVSGGATAPTTLGQLDASMSVSFSQESVDDLWQGPAQGYAFRALRIEPSIFKSWDRENVEFVKPAKLALGMGPSAAKPGELAVSDSFDPGMVKVSELTPSGRAGRTVRVSAFNSAARAKARRGASRSAGGRKRSGARKRKR